ncbi:MAG TPA: protein kinase [Tepidisphaeraceae bacterium]|nr:protein kinase [Tepidisphaeraceae bacterium]
MQFSGVAIREGPGTVIGRYKLLQLIGEGGFGSVFMAEQTQPVHRKVALKIIKLGMDTRAVIARFEAERQALALMDHPHIARVLDAGATETGRPYFVMELVRGDPITDFCDANHLCVSERLDLFTQVCRAVQHAHQRGIIHRDIKPGNVLVSMQDGRAFARVIDFGIAKALADRLTEKTLFTEYRQFVGTPAYMSPEQAAGTLDIDTRTDVYSLGALLYELLTGSAPFDARELRSAAYEEMRRIIREVEPPKPSTRLNQSMQTLVGIAANRRTESKRLGGLVRGDLDWIVMKALEKDRARRYESANELAADILRHATGEAVIAVPPTALYRFGKFARRHKAALATAAALFGVAIAGASISAWQAMRAHRALAVAVTRTNEADSARARALKARANAIAQTRLAKHQLADGLVSQGDALRLAGRTLNARDRLVQSRNLYQELGLSVMPADLGLFSLAIEHPPALMTYSVKGVAWSIAFSPDGRTALSGSLDGTLKLWDLPTGQVLRTFPKHASGIISVAFSRDGRSAASCYYDLAIKRWDIATGRELSNVTARLSNMMHVAFSPDGQTALCCGYDPAPRLIDLATGAEIRAFSGHLGGAESVAFSPDGRTALSGNGSAVGGLTLWDIATGKELRTFSGHTHLVESIAFSPDGRTFLSGSRDRTLKLWDVATGRNLRTFSSHTDAVESVAFSPDGRTALSGSDDGTLKLWDIASGMNLRTFAGHTGPVHGVVVSPDGRAALSCSNDGTLKLWDLSAGQEPRTFQEHGGSVQSVAISPDGRMALSANQDKTLTLRDIATGKKMRAFSGHAAPVESVAFSPDGRTALSGSEDKTLKLWDLSTGKEIRTFSGHGGPVYASRSPPMAGWRSRPATMAQCGCGISRRPGKSAGSWGMPTL